MGSREHAVASGVLNLTQLSNPVLAASGATHKIPRLVRQKWSISQLPVSR